MENNLNYSEQLKKFMKVKNINQDQLGKMLGVTQQTISFWIKGKDISKAALFLLSNHLEWLYIIYELE